MNCSGAQTGAASGARPEPHAGGDHVRRLDDGEVVVAWVALRRAPVQGQVDGDTFSALVMDVFESNMRWLNVGAAINRLYALLLQVPRKIALTCSNRLKWWQLHQQCRHGCERADGCHFLATSLRQLDIRCVCGGKAAARGEECSADAETWLCNTYEL